MNQVLNERPRRLSGVHACRALSLNRSSVYARRSRLDNAEPPRRSRKDTSQPRALSPAERQHVLDTLHSGAPMTAHAYLDFMGERGATCSHSRPRVSNDNPFSESQFKTQKYQPDYPGRFDDVLHARRWCESYFDWYNFNHHHSALRGFTPEQVFTGRYVEVAAEKQRALDAHYHDHPKRFVRGQPRVALPPESVAINPITVPHADDDVDQVNFPTLTAAGAVKSTLSFH